MFADTAGLACLLDRRQLFHAQAATLARQTFSSGRPLITTNFVLAELTALLTSPLRIPKPQQIRWLNGLRFDPDIEIVVVDLFRELAAWNLWTARPDKDWSFVDCASFVVMQQRGLTEALTTDHHFEQAGFVRLLK
jgi:predicted nucleic acid-binding protein